MRALLSLSLLALSWTAAADDPVDPAALYATCTATHDEEDCAALGDHLL